MKLGLVVFALLLVASAPDALFFWIVNLFLKEKTDGKVDRT